jgi:hypothetical protein
MPRESAGVDIRLSSGGDGIETHTRRYGSERRSQRSLQNFGTRFDSLRARHGDVLREAVLPCKQALRVRLPTSPPRRISTEVVLTVGIGADPVRLRNAAPGEHGRMVRHWSSKPATRVRFALLAPGPARPRCFGSMPECHSGRPGSTPGGRTTTCRSGDQRCLQNGARAVRFRGTSPRTSRWLGGPPSKRTREGSNPSWCTTPRSTSGEVIGLSSRSDGLDTHTRCPVSAGGSGGLATNEAGGGSTPPRDAARLSPADLAATLRTSHDAVRLCARAPASMEQWWLTTLIR